MVRFCLIYTRRSGGSQGIHVRLIGDRPAQTLGKNHLIGEFDH